MEPPLKASALVLVVLAACQTRAPAPLEEPRPVVVTPVASVVASAPPAPVASAPPPAPARSGAEDAGVVDEQCDPARFPKVLSRIACIQDDTLQNGRAAGFSKDGRYLGMCVSSCDPCPLHCELDDAVTKGKKSFTFASSLSDPGMGKDPEDVVQARVEKKNRVYESFLADNAIPQTTKVRSMRGKWPYPDMVFAVRSDADAKNGTAVLDFGASVDGAEPVYPIHIVIGPRDLWREAAAHVPPKATPKEREAAIAQWHEGFSIDPPSLAYVDVSSDGKDLGVIAFARGTMWFEEAKSVRMPVATFAARVREMTAEAAKKKR